MDILVSVIIPVYNVEKYIHKCVDSVLNQTLKNIEIILINDGSTDNSGEICDYYRQFDERVKVIHLKNRGASNARNIGIENAQGKYIMFSDSDDYVEDIWCETMLNIIENNNKSFIVSGYKLINKRNKNVSIKEVNLDFNNKLTRINKKDFYLLYEYNLLNSPCNKIFETEILKINNIRYDINLSLGEDMLFNLTYLKYTNNNIIVYNKPLYNYVLKDNESLDYKFYPDLFEIYRKIYYELYDKMKEFNADNNSNIEKYWISYFYMLEKCLKNTFSNKNKQNILEKFNLNKKILNSSEFESSLKYVKHTDINKIYIWAFTSRNYLLIMIVNKLITTLYNIKKLLNTVVK